jgi:Putative binding domain, N-terminal
MRRWHRRALPVALLIVQVCCSSPNRPTPPVTPSVSLSPTSQAVPANGGTFNATVSGNSSWTLNSDASWVTVSSGGTGNGNGSATYTVTANPGAARSAHLVAASGSASATLTINQDAASGPPPSSAQLQVDPVSQTVAPGGESRSATVTSNVSWTATSDASWLHINSGASGTGNGTIGYTADPNAGAARSGHITVAGGGLTATHTVNQGAVTANPPSINPTTNAVVAAGGSFSAAVTATGAWTAAGNQPSWLTITSGASGSGNGTIAYTVAANSGGARSAQITVTSSGGTATLTVNQAAAPAGTLSLNPTTQNVATGGGSFATQVTASGAWNATPDVPWINITSGASGIGNGTINYTVAANSTVARSGYITVTSGTLSQQLKVTEDTGVVTISFTVTSTDPTPVLGGDCWVRPGAVYQCKFDASASGPASLITGYQFRIVDTNFVLGTSQILTNPTGTCGFLLNAPTPLTIELTVTTKAGTPAPAPFTKVVYFVKGGGC